jgi:hypothetical protein
MTDIKLNDIFKDVTFASDDITIDNLEEGASSNGEFTDDSLKADLNNTNIEDNDSLIYDKVKVLFVCEHCDTKMEIVFSSSADIPYSWVCVNCSEKAYHTLYKGEKDSQTEDKTNHINAIRSRRSDEELDQMLNDRLKQMDKGEFISIDTLMQFQQ